MKPLRIAIIGCGLIGQKRAAAAHPHVVTVTADVDITRAQALAAKHGAAAFSSWQQAVATDVDVIVVATSHDGLAEIARSALLAGKHVLIEKPGGRTAKELIEIAQLAEAKGLVAKVGFNHRFHPSFVEAKQMLTSGEFGPVLFVRAAYGHGGRPGYEKEWRFQREVSGGGQLIDQGAHLIDLSRWLMGEVTKASGVLRTFFWDAEVEDNCFVSLETSAGSVAWLHAGWTEWKNRFSFEIMARDAKFEIQGLGGSYGVERLTFYRMLPGMGPPETTSWEWPFPDASWQAEMDNLFAAIDGREKVNGDATDAARMLEIVEQIYEQNIESAASNARTV
jgi:predicted dehydrogenase